MNMNITMFIETVKTMPASQGVYVKGDHGIGKTSIMKQIAEYFGLELVIFNCSEMADVSDVIGMPTIETYIDSNGVEQKRTTWAAPFWYHPDKPVLLVFDEYPRARQEITNATMSLVLDHKLLDKKLPEGSRVFACGNPAGGHYNAEVLDPAKLDRWWVVTLKPTLEEFIKNYTEVEKGHPSIPAYLLKNRNDLDPWTNLQLSDGDDTAEVVLPSRRAYVMASQWLQNSERIFGGKLTRSFVVDGMAGFVGEGVANKFWPFYNEASNQIGAEDILNDYDGLVGDDKVKALATPDADILMRNIILWCAGVTDATAVTDDNKANFKKFFNALAPEVQAAICRDTIQKNLLSGEAMNITLLSDEEMEMKFLELASAAL